MTILLCDILPITNPESYKLHFAKEDPKNVKPLDVWARDKEEWQGWQEFWPGRNDFNLPYIFSLIDFYHEKDSWLFGGIYTVLACHKGEGYEVKLNEKGVNLIGRLKLRYSYTDRAPRVFFNKHYPKLEAAEILREPYSGIPFPGFEKIDISFAELEGLVKHNRPDWMAALSSIKGVYLITDTEAHMRYVGSAFGDNGIWSRWSDYILKGHGGNKKLEELVNRRGLEYCRKSFRFSLLEAHSSNTSDKNIINREEFWKQILLARREYN